MSDNEENNSNENNGQYSFEQASSYIDPADNICESEVNDSGVTDGNLNEGVEDSRIKDNLIPFERFTAVTSIPFEVDQLRSFTCNTIPSIYDNIEYLRTRGLTPIPARASSKNLKKIADHDPRYDDINFQQGDNIAIKIGEIKESKSGVQSEFAIVDLDLEVEESRIFAYHLLKQVETATFGRRSAARSHYLFRTRTREINNKKNQFEWPAGMRSRNKLDADSALILELKPSGHCLVPPSTHPSGEKLFWMRENIEIATLPYKDIYALAGKIAAGTVLLRSWASGLRDNIVISTAGWLLKEGWTYRETAEFMNALFSCAWPIDQTDVRRWRIRIQTLAKEIEKSRQDGDLKEDDDYQLSSDTSHETRDYLSQ